MNSFHSFKKAVIEALVYFELFNFAPRADELHRMIGLQISFSEFCHILQCMDGLVLEDGYIVLNGSEHLIRQRLSNLSQSASKLFEGQEWGRRIGAIPGVLAVFLTGSVAAGCGRSDDDLDYLVLVMPGRVWLVRLFLYIASRIWKPSSRLCFNFIVGASDHVMVMAHNLYVATELALMLPVYDEGYYLRFMKLNSWMSKFRPNSSPYFVVHDDPSFLKRILVAALSFPPFSILDWLEMKRALGRMRILPPSEEVSVHREMYKGHFSNHGLSILKQFSENIQKRFNEDCEN